MRYRADQLLLKQGLVSSRERAQVLILAGQVFSSKGRIDKSSQMLDEAEPLEVREGLKYVGRGGIKLEHALKEFEVKVLDKICLDIGASTGGFTDCLLQQGARKIYSVDVGYGQLHYKLREDPRVVMLEKINFRYVNSDKISEPIDLVVADVSFISLDKIIPRLKIFLAPQGRALVLVKPQFELQPSEVRKGVVRSEDLRNKALEKIKGVIAESGFYLKGMTPSPIKGADGNQEYFLVFSFFSAKVLS